MPKGEWREEGLGHYDPLSSHEIDGRSGRGKDSDDVTLMEKKSRLFNRHAIPSLRFHILFFSSFLFAQDLISFSFLFLIMVYFFIILLLYHFPKGMERQR